MSDQIEPHPVPAYEKLAHHIISTRRDIALKLTEIGMSELETTLRIRAEWEHDVLESCKQAMEQQQKQIEMLTDILIHKTQAEPMQIVTTGGKLPGYL